MLVITATNPKASPHWNWTRGGRPFLPEEWSVNCGLTHISFQTLSVYTRRTSSPDSYVSNISVSVILAGSPPPNSYSPRFLPLAGGTDHLLDFAIEYSLGLKRQ